MGKSWRTTVAGVAAFLAALFADIKAVSDDDPETKPNIEMTVALGAVAIGLITARDNKVSSERAGAK